MASPTMRFLSDEDVAVLSRLIHEFKNRPQNGPHGRTELGEDNPNSGLFVKVPEDGIPAREIDEETGEITLHGARCQVYRSQWDELDKRTLVLDETWFEWVLNPTDELIEAGIVYTHQAKDATRLALLQEAGGLRGACLQEDHPGRGTPFEVRLGTWDPDDMVWVYDDGPLAMAVDWRYGVPYPGSGATGLFQARASTEHGTIWEVVALDCTSPGDCGD